MKKIYLITCTVKLKGSSGRTYKEAIKAYEKKFDALIQTNVWNNETYNYDIYESKEYNIEEINLYETF